MTNGKTGGGRGTNQHRIRGVATPNTQQRRSGREPANELTLADIIGAPPATNETESEESEIRHRLWQIGDSAELCAEIVAQAVTVGTFNDSRVHLAAAMQAIANIGEAVRHLPDNFKAARPDIPWTAIRGLRNRVSHGYDTVDVDILWRTITTSVPELAEQLAAS